MSDLPTLTPITDPQNPTPTAVPAENAYALTYTGKNIHGTVRTVQASPNGTPSQILASFDRIITHHANRRGITLNLPEEPTAQDIIPILRPVWKDPDNLAIVPARERFTQAIQRLGHTDEAGNTTWRLALAHHPHGPPIQPRQARRPEPAPLIYRLCRRGARRPLRGPAATRGIPPAPDEPDPDHHRTGNRRAGTPLRASDRLHHPQG